MYRRVCFPATGANPRKELSPASAGLFLWSGAAVVLSRWVCRVSQLASLLKNLAPLLGGAFCTPERGDARLWRRPESDPRGIRFAVTKPAMGLRHICRPRPGATQRRASTFGDRETTPPRRRKRHPLPNGSVLSSSTSPGRAQPAPGASRTRALFVFAVVAQAVLAGSLAHEKNSSMSLLTIWKPAPTATHTSPALASLLCFKSAFFNGSL